jgi:type IV secretory pathway VirJ component
MTLVSRYATLDSGVHRYVFPTILAFFMLCLLALSGCTESSREPMSTEEFGRIEVYRPKDPPKGLVMLLSGDAGWDSNMAELANEVMELDYLVAGIDTRNYLRRLTTKTQACSNPGLDFAALGQHLQKGPGSDSRKLSILVGVSSGASLAYAAVAQASARTYHAAVSLDFCPTLPSKLRFCKGQGLEASTSSDSKGTVFSPNKQLQTPWFVFQDPHYRGCDMDSANGFIRQIDNVKLVVASSGPEADAQPDLRQQFLALMAWLDPGIGSQAEFTTDLSGVPLVEVPATDGSEYLALILTGDGGWAALDKAVASRLMRRHISTLGWDSLSYFWRARTPDEAGADLERSLRHYLVAWEKQRVLLIGYSFGADVLPFMANRLPPDLRGRIELVVLLGPGPSASFEFHLTDWLGSSSSAKRYPILTELQKLTWTKVLCLSGQQDENSICPTLNLPNITVEQMPGDHHFNDDYGNLVSRILALLPDHTLGSTTPSVTESQ